MERKTLIRLAAASFVALVIGAAVIELTREEDDPDSPGRAEEPATDPLRAELIRCQRLGEAGTRDAACLHAWAANRERFLTPGSGAAARSPLAEPARPEAPSR